jgi:hypothetical protein
MTTPLFDHAELRRIADALEGLLALARAYVTPAAATAAPADRDSVQQAFDAKMGDPLTALDNLSHFAELTRNVPIGIAMNDAQPGEELRVKLTFKAPAKYDPQLVAERQAAYDAALSRYDAIALRGTRKQKDDACRAIDEAEQALTLARFPGYDPAPAPAPADEQGDDVQRIRWSKYDPRSRELAKLRTAAKHRAQAAKTAETRFAAELEAQRHHTESKNRHRRLRRWLDQGKIVIDGDVLYRVAADGTKTRWAPSPDPSFTLPE